MSAVYAKFAKINSTNELKTNFMSEMTFEVLKYLIKKYRLTLSFHKSFDHDDLYIVMIVGKSDNDLVKIGKSHGFPRGFPIVWHIGKSMRYFGFYPKFDNDQRQTIDNLDEFNGVVQIDFFRKFSGYLVQLIAFEHNGVQYWTICSKNSADGESKFIQDAYDVIHDSMTSLTDTMIKDKLHICGELMSVNDQCHGTQIIQEAFIVTTIGTGHTTNIGTVYAKPDKFVNFMSNNELSDFCHLHGLFCDDSVSITGDMCEQFLKTLTDGRDFMTNDKLTSMIDSIGATVKVGTTNHASVLGNVLEGIVFHLVFENGTKMTKKYKFPMYTVRTMLLRPLIGNGYVYGKHLLKPIKSYVDNWCVTENGKKYWANFALHCLKEAKVYDYCPLVGKHIQISDHLLGLSHDLEPITNFDDCTNHTVIICMGPIGSGKSSYAEHIVKSIQNAEHIDGDVLGLTKEVVGKLGIERNDYTIWKVIECLMAGKVPVVSTGGGVFFSMKKEATFILRERIMSVLNVNVKIILCITGQVENIEPVTSEEIVASYLDDTKLGETIKYRLDNGIWNFPTKFGTYTEKSLKSFVQYIKNISDKNKYFAHAISKDADYAIMIPCISNDNYGIQEKIDLSPLVSEITEPKGQIPGKFTQIRLLTWLNDHAYHITYSYNQEGIMMNLDDFSALDKFNGNCKGTLYMVSEVPESSGSKVGTYVYVKVDEDICGNGYTHITVDQLNHRPVATKDIMMAIENGSPSILLEHIRPGGKQIKYDLHHHKTKPCNFFILKSFGI